MKIFFLAFTLSIVPHFAYAYIGPGAGIAVIGTFFGFAAAMGALVVMVLAWPAWILWKKLKASRASTQKNEPPKNEP